MENQQVGSASKFFVSDCRAEYDVNRENASRRIIAEALLLLEQDLVKPGWYAKSPGDFKDYARLKIGSLPYEVFSVFFFDANYGLVAYEELFRGTLTQTSIYPREVLIRALHHNAASVGFAHNHPSGDTQPSRQDEHVTQALKSALGFVDVRVVDHIVVSKGSASSMAELGLI